MIRRDVGRLENVTKKVGFLVFENSLYAIGTDLYKFFDGAGLTS